MLLKTTFTHQSWIFQGPKKKTKKIKGFLSSIRRPTKDQQTIQLIFFSRRKGPSNLYFSKNIFPSVYSNEYFL